MAQRKKFGKEHQNDKKCPKSQRCTFCFQSPNYRWLMVTGISKCDYTISLSHSFIHKPTPTHTYTHIYTQSHTRIPTHTRAHTYTHTHTHTLLIEVHFHLGAIHTLSQEKRRTKKCYQKNCQISQISSNPFKTNRQKASKFELLLRNILYKPYKQ